MLWKAYGCPSASLNPCNRNWLCKARAYCEILRVPLELLKSSNLQHIQNAYEMSISVPYSKASAASMYVEKPCPNPLDAAPVLDPLAIRRAHCSPLLGEVSTKGLEHWLFILVRGTAISVPILTTKGQEHIASSSTNSFVVFGRGPNSTAQKLAPKSHCIAMTIMGYQICLTIHDIGCYAVRRAKARPHASVPQCN